MCVSLTSVSKGTIPTLEIEKLTVILLISAALVLILKTFGFKGTPIFAAVVVAASASLFIERLASVMGVMSEYTAVSELSEYVKTASKAVGIGYLCGISVDICKEMGENGIAKCIALGARLELAVIAVPYIEKILSVAWELLG